jgi:hypothetical protein
MILSLRFAFYFTQHYTMQLLYDDKTGDHYYMKSAASDDITFISKEEKKLIEEKLASQNVKGLTLSGKFEFDRSSY